MRLQPPSQLENEIATGVMAASSMNTPDPIQDPPSSDNEEDVNDVVSLKMGIVKTSKDVTQAPYTILLVGETGVGKSSVLEFIANVLIGNDIDHYNFNILDHSNEQGGSDSQSQNNSARVYNLESKNGKSVRILDTPGLADTRGLQQDEIHKKSISTQIQMHFDSVSAVLILANGTVPRITVGTDYALSTLSALFPRTLANNIAFMFTNIASPLSWNFSHDNIPLVLRSAPQYLLDNPIALQKKYRQLKGDLNRKKVKEMRRAVKDGEQKALETLVEFFDWLDGLQPQRTTEIVYLYDKSQAIEANITDTLATMDQAAAKRTEIDNYMRESKKNAADMDAFSNFEKIIKTPVWKQKPTDAHNTLCGQTSCYSNCHIRCRLSFSLDPKNLKNCVAMTDETCHQCGHSLWNHHHFRVRWDEVEDEQVVVDDDMKKKWEAAKDERAKMEALIDASERALDMLNRVIYQATEDLSQLAGEYAALSLSGSFSAQVEKAISLLEQRYKGMQEQGVGQEQLEKVKIALDRMKQKLEVLKEANTKRGSLIQTGRHYVQALFSGFFTK